MKIDSDLTVLVCRSFFDFYTALGNVSDLADLIREKLAEALESGEADEWQDQDDMWYWLNLKLGYEAEFELFPFHGYGSVQIKR